MEFQATQIYEDDDFLPTQKIPHTIEEEEPVGTLSIDSKEYRIRRGITKIGRLDICDIVLNDGSVSKIHAEIEAMTNQGSRIWICDLNSSNKTKLDHEILLPTRLYEVKDGNTIKFGRVCATYRAYRPMVIPETPAPSRKRLTDTIIPSTPDLSLNNSTNDDGSIILATQRDEQSNVFRRPLPQRQSTSIGKKNTSHAFSNKSDNLQTALHASDVNISENRESNNIFDMETQKIEGNTTIPSNSIHNIETQILSTDTSTHLIQANTEANKQLQSKQNEIASTSTIDIHDMETQHYESYIKELQTRKSEDNIQNVTPKKCTTDIHNVETQNYINGNNQDGNNIKKSEIDNCKNQKKDLEAQFSINDLETQKLNSNDIVEDISNAKTQSEINGIKKVTTKILNVRNQLEIDAIVNDINKDHAYTDKDNIAKTKNGANDDNEKNKDNMIETIKTKINYDNVAPNSGSSSPGSLILSSSGVDEDCLSPLQCSDHLLESSDLLEYFSEGIDKREEIRASNASTPKSHMKTSSEKDNNISVSNNDEDNIFDALTQHTHEYKERSDKINEKDISKKKPESKENSDDNSKIDTEDHSKKLAKEQHESSEISDKSCNSTGNRNNPGTSVESEDMFDALTQQLNDPTVKDTSNSSINQLSKVNEIVNNAVDDITPTQIINNNENTHNQGNLIDKSLEDINNSIEDGQKQHSDHKKIEESFQVIADDSLEQKLKEMFDNVNNSINEPQHMSTQALEDILESDNDLSVNTYTVNESSLRDSVSPTQLKNKNVPCNQSPCDAADTEANNVNKMESDSQNSDIYFSTLTTRRKKNILKDIQEPVDSTHQNVISSHQDSNTLQVSKISNEKIQDNTVTEFKKKKRKPSRLRNESDIMTDTLNDNNITETISNKKNERNLRHSKRKYEVESKMNKQILTNDKDQVKVDDVEKDSGNKSNVCAPCSSKDVERTQTSNLSCESDDDILTRLPAVRISGTLSNPACSSTSSTPTVSSASSEEDIVKSINMKIVRNKLLCKQRVENSEEKESLKQIQNKSSVSLLDNDTSSFNASEINKVTRQLDISEDSETDSEMNYKRFKQMAERIMPNNERDLKKHSKRNVQNTSDKRKSVHFSPNLLKETELKSSSQTSSRVTRYSSRQNGENLDVSREETRMENTIYDKSTKPETISIAARRKRTLDTIEQDVGRRNLRKRKIYQDIEECPLSTRLRRNTVTTIERQSPSILDYFTNTSSRENSPVIGSTKSSQDNKAVPETTLEEKALNLKTDKNVDFGRYNLKRAKRKIDDDQVAIDINKTVNNSSVNNKQVEAQEKQTAMILSQDKVLKIILSPIKSSTINSTDEESQEVEMIMGKGLNNVQDKNLPNRETNTMRIFQRNPRIRSKKQLNIKTDSASTKNSMSSIDISDDSQSDDSDSILKTEKPKRFTKNTVAGTQVLKNKETFKKPTRINQNFSASDSSTENTTNESSQNSVGNNTLLSSRSSRSKTASIKNKEKKVTRSTHSMTASTAINDSTSSRINTSIEITPPPSTPSTRMRRSTSVLSSSSPFTTRHRILFTGVMEDYSIIVETLGGYKMDDLAKCNVLVTDKIRRTYKFLCALAKGIPIVTIDWLRDSEAAARFLDWEGYILKDPAAEAKFGFRLRKSLDMAKKKKLLDGYTVVLTPNVAPPPIEELKDMIIFCGGKPLLRPPSKWPEKTVIISREEDLPNARKFLVKAPKTVTIQSTEFILTGILRQETDFDKYRMV